MSEIKNIVADDATIIWRNFAGNPDNFNPKGGKRQFNLVIDPADVDDLIDEGWNIKHREPREGVEGDTLYYLPVRVNYEGKRPPKIYLITERKKKKTLLDESTVASLDYAEIINVDLVVSPYPWSFNGKSGISAYLQTMYVTIAEDEFADKYGDYDEDPDEIAFG